MPDTKRRTLLLTMRDAFGTPLGVATLDITDALDSDPAFQLAQQMTWCGRFVQTSHPSVNAHPPAYIDVSSDG